MACHENQPTQPTWAVSHHRQLSEEDTTMTEFPPASLKPLILEIFSLLRVRDESVSVAETVRGSFLSFSMPLWTDINVFDISITGCRWSHLRVTPLHSRRISHI